MADMLVEFDVDVVIPGPARRLSFPDSGRAIAFERPEADRLASKSERIGGASCRRPAFARNPASNWSNLKCRPLPDRDPDPAKPAWRTVCARPS